MTFREEDKQDAMYEDETSSSGRVKLTGFRLAFYVAYTARGLSQREVGVLLFREPHDVGIPLDRLYRKYQPRISEFLSGEQWLARNIYDRIIREFPELEGLYPEEGFYGETRKGHGERGGNPDAAGGKEIPKEIRAPFVGVREHTEVEVAPPRVLDERAIVIVDGKAYLEGDEPETRGPEFTAAAIVRARDLLVSLSHLLVDARDALSVALEAVSK